MPESPPAALSMKSRGKAYDLTVEAGEAVMATGFASVAFLFSAADPAHTRAAARPFDERLDACGQCRPAGIRAVMDDERVRQGRR